MYSGFDKKKKKKKNEFGKNVLKYRALNCCDPPTLGDTLCAKRLNLLFLKVSNAFLFLKSLVQNNP